jgi:hypothetical protein
LKQTQILLSAGTTMTYGHDVDTLGWASNTWLHVYLPYPLHVHVAGRPTQTGPALTHLSHDGLLAHVDSQVSPHQWTPR